MRNCTRAVRRHDVAAPCHLVGSGQARRRHELLGRVSGWAYSVVRRRRGPVRRRRRRRRMRRLSGRCLGGMRYESGGGGGPRGSAGHAQCEEHAGGGECRAGESLEHDLSDPFGLEERASSVADACDLGKPDTSLGESGALHTHQRIKKHHGYPQFHQNSQITSHGWAWFRSSRPRTRQDAASRTWRDREEYPAA
jgi:hypothetical protein